VIPLFPQTFDFPQDFTDQTLTYIF